MIVSHAMDDIYLFMAIYIVQHIELQLRQSLAGIFHSRLSLSLLPFPRPPFSLIPCSETWHLSLVGLGMFTVSMFTVSMQFALTDSVQLA